MNPLMFHLGTMKSTSSLLLITFSRYYYLYLLHEKSQLVDILKVSIDDVEMQLDRKVKIVRFDRDDKIRNLTLIDMVRFMLNYNIVLLSLWIHALKTSMYLLNRVPSKAVLKTSY
ncbi:hypothetical protein CR513_25120, partial [Mucuna pruriens]